MSAILFLDRNKFDFYGSNLPSIVTFPFQPTVVKDIELLNPEELTKQIAAFITTNKIKPTNIFIVIADTILFTKDLPNNLKPEDQEAQIEAFLDIVPFGNKAHKLYASDKNIRVAVTNRDLYEAIQQGFKTQGFTLESVTPAFVLGQSIIGLTPDIAKSILRKTDFLKQNGFVVIAEIPHTPQAIEEQETKQTDKKNTKILVGVFLFLLVVLALVIWQSGILSPPKRIESTNTSPTLSATTSVAPPSPTEVPISPTTITSTFHVEIAKVQVLNGSGIPGQAEEIKKKLTDLGFKDIKTGNASELSLSKTLIIFLPTVPTDLREKILDSLKEIITSPSIQESNDGLFDITITTNKE